MLRKLKNFIKNKSPLLPFTKETVRQFKKQWVCHSERSEESNLFSRLLKPDSSAIPQKDNCQTACKGWRGGITAARMGGLLIVSILTLSMLLIDTPVRASDTVHYEFTLGAGVVRFTKDPVLQSFYNNKYVPMYQINAGVLFYHFVGIDGSIGFVYKKNTIDVQPGVGQQYVLMVYPARLDAVLQLRVTDDQVLYPYIGGGGVATGFYQTASGGGKTVSGYKYGYNWIGGIHFVLDPIDRRHVGNLRTEYGINHVYIDVRIGQDMVNNFHKSNSGFDLSTQYIIGALGFEF